MEIEIIITVTTLIFVIIYLCVLLYTRYFSKNQKSFSTSVIQPPPLVKYVNPFSVQIQHINNILIIILANQLKCYLGIYWNVNIHNFLQISHKPWTQISTFKSFHELILETCTNSQFILINEANKKKELKFDILCKEKQRKQYQSSYPAVIITMLTEDDINTEDICLLITIVHISCDEIPLQTTIISQLIRRPNSLPFYLKKMYIPQESDELDKDTDSSNIVEYGNSQKSNSLNLQDHNIIDSTNIKADEDNIQSRHDNGHTNSHCTEELPENSINITKNSTSLSILLPPIYNEAGISMGNSVNESNRELSWLHNADERVESKNDENHIIDSESSSTTVLRNRKATKTSNIILTNNSGKSGLFNDCKHLNYGDIADENANSFSTEITNENIFGNSYKKKMSNQHVDQALNSSSSNGEVKVTLCSVCLLQKVTRITLPCRHVCTCDTCYNKLTNCPLCRSLISYTLPIRFS